MRKAAAISSRLGVFSLALVMGSLAFAADPPGMKRGPDGKPDFTGLWTNAGGPGIGGATRVAPTTPSPIKPEAKAKVDHFRELVTPTGETPGQYCLGTGMPGSMLGSGGYPMMIMQRPEQFVVIYEAHTELRQFFLGSRNADQRDRVPGRNGYSSAHWEGDTLVVETDNLIEQLDMRDFNHSDEAKIVERYHLEPELDKQGRRVLVADMTMTDPKWYTAPVTSQKKWAEVANGRLLPYECPEEAWDNRIRELEEQFAAKQKAGAK